MHLKNDGPVGHEKSGALLGTPPTRWERATQWLQGRGRSTAGAGSGVLAMVGGALALALGMRDCAEAAQVSGGFLFGAGATLMLHGCLHHFVCARQPAGPHGRQSRSWTLAVLVSGVLCLAVAMAGVYATVHVQRRTCGGQEGLEAVAALFTSLCFALGADALLRAAKQQLLYDDAGADSLPALRYVRLLCCSLTAQRLLCVLPFAALSIASAAEVSRVWNEDCGAHLHAFVVGSSAILAAMALAFGLVLFAPFEVFGLKVSRVPWVALGTTALLGAAGFAWGVMGLVWMQREGAEACREAHPRLWAVAIMDKVMLITVAAVVLSMTCCCRTETCMMRTEAGSFYIVTRDTLEQARRQTA